MCIAMLFTFSFQYSCTKEICQLCGSELQRHMNANICDVHFSFRNPTESCTQAPPNINHNTTTSQDYTCFLISPITSKAAFFPQTPPLSLTHTVGDLICLDAVTPHSAHGNLCVLLLCLSSLQGTSHLHIPARVWQRRSEREMG